MLDNNITLIAGRSGTPFKKEVVKALVEKYDYPEEIDGPVVAKDFACGELFTQLGKNQANRRIHFFQSFTLVVNWKSTGHRIWWSPTSTMELFNFKKERFWDLNQRLVI